MEISFANETANAHMEREIPLRKTAAIPTREKQLDSISDNIRSGLKSAAADPEQLLEQTVEGGAHVNAINEAHDFNMERVMALLSDPLLQDDI